MPVGATSTSQNMSVCGNKDDHQYLIQGITDTLPIMMELTTQATGYADGSRDVTFQPIVCFDLSDANYEAIYRDRAEIVDVEQKMELETTFQYVPVESSSAIETLIDDLVRGGTPLMDEDGTFVLQTTTAATSPSTTDVIHPTPEINSLEERIQQIMNEGLVMNGTTWVEQSNMAARTLIETEEEKMTSRPTSPERSKHKEFKKKKIGEPSVVEGMDVSTKKSAEKLARDLVEVIKGLSVDTSPEDIFEGIKGQFKNAGTHLYPIICGIVYSLNGPKRSVGVQVEAEENTEIGKDCLDAKKETTTEANVLDESDEDWNISGEMEEFEKTEESSDEGDLGSYVEVTLE